MSSSKHFRHLHSTLKERQMPCVVECAKMSKQSHAENEEIGLVCFLLHANEVTCSKCEALGLESAHVARICVKSLRKLEDLIDFEYFSDEHSNFEKYYAPNLVHNAWNGVESLKTIVGSIARKSMKREGSSFDPSKSVSCPLSSESWCCVKYMLPLSNSEFLANKHHAKSQNQAQTEACNFSCRNKMEPQSFRNYNLIQFFTIADRLLLRNGSNKGCAVKRSDCIALLTLSDTMSAVESTECPNNFSRRHLTDFGIGTMQSKGTRAKTQACFKTTIASSVLPISEMIECMTASEEMASHNGETEKNLDASIEPERSMLCHENCTLRV